MCDECEKLKAQLEFLRAQWNSIEATRSRSYQLSLEAMGGPCGWCSIGYDKNGKLIYDSSYERERKMKNKNLNPTVEKLEEKISPTPIVHPVHVVDTDPVEKGGLTPIIIGVPTPQTTMIA